MCTMRLLLEPTWPAELPPAMSMRSRCSVNGAVTSLRVLRELGAALVDVNGQNSAQSLRWRPSQLAAACPLGRCGATAHSCMLGGTPCRER